jgi:hypothetical protein
MKNNFSLLPWVFACLMVVVLFSVSPTRVEAAIGDCLSTEEAELVGYINAYRQQNGQPAIAVSKSLVTVAQYHVQDLQTHRPDTGTDNRGIACNIHSWSANGVWSPVCYTPDHNYASGMWNKPKEITNNVYSSSGFEISYRTGVGATAENAFNGWQGSPPHDAVMLNQGIWADFPFQAVGVGIYGNYAVVWFGQQADPQGTVALCNSLTTADYDVNNDDDVSPTDVAYVLNRIGSGDMSADVDSNNSVTATDATLIVDHIGESVP